MLPLSRRGPTAVALVAAAAAALLTTAPTPLLGAGPAHAATAQAAALPTGFATVVNAASGKCLDAKAAATANGTAVQQYACNGTTAQQWSFTDAGSGYVHIDSRNDTNQVVDVSDVSTADNAPVHLWSYGGGANQQWQAVHDGGGAFHFVNKNSGKCLDDPSASTAESVQFVQYTCNGTAAQRFQVVPVTPSSSDPDLGPNVVVFDPSMSSSTIQSRLDTIFKQQETNQFGSQRYAVLFKPGAYSADGGAGVGKAVTSLVVNSRNVIGDHMWIWRADHGSGVGWTSNTADTGLVVNGDDVTMYGLFVEHFQKYQVIWNGNGGRTYFFQNEMPYDPPNQSAWMNGSTKGYAAYEVADSVTSHQAYGLGSYCYFNADPSVTADRAFEVPDNPNVRFTSMVTVSLAGTGTIGHVIDNTGGPSNSSANVADLVRYP
ncbi:ricin-type beta-trefoil lectin protein [Streptomyces puniciscabiei]|uniref:Ricin-type beta-trefoil lectin protein n=1 Tax=Streptomyces puniciscabiei TaxID=164348 RepID=A0A542SZQ2_9ACTN|nr:RICIN domain-containing protein [Streptomyces puniciscabiei]TQK80094.1 ricin-type beta-trefoil lectin protein [Streptomyces puniciscabiei]